jgi:hypothetical protein
MSRWLVRLVEQQYDRFFKDQPARLTLVFSPPLRL